MNSIEESRGKFPSNSISDYYEEYHRFTPTTVKIPLGNKKRFDFFLPYFKEPILEVGCSKGYNLNYLQKLGFNELYGIDISETAITEAKKSYSKITFFNLDLQKKPFKKKIQTVVAFDVIEHVFDINSFVENIYLTLNNGGYLLLTAPNVLGLKNRIKFLFGKGSFFISEQNEPHIRFFTVPTMLKKLKQHGFTDFKVFRQSKIPFLPKNLCGCITLVAKKEG